MTVVRGLFLTDGPSDEPLAGHIEHLCGLAGFQVRITTPDLRRLPRPVGRTVIARLEAALNLDPTYEIIFVHRDAEKQQADVRVREVLEAASAASVTQVVVPVVPVRMTEAWLLLDEVAIRAVAGRPDSYTNLSLPAARDVERVPDPKRMLQEALLRAADLTGRRRKRFAQRFPEHRRLLLARLDPTGPVSELSAWTALQKEIDAAAEHLVARRSPE